ncbi:Protein of unknown function [Gryllus bimaculatus]|nr:Protein of unknown function [Gryllus bimaculatus]
MEVQREVCSGVWNGGHYHPLISFNDRYFKFDTETHSIFNCTSLCHNVIEFLCVTKLDKYV